MEGHRRKRSRRTSDDECAQPDARFVVARRVDAPLCRRGRHPAQQFFQFDIWALSIADRKTRPVIQTPANEMSPELSPDGRWLAYVSNQTGRMEVYVEPYPGPGERHLISTNGGFQPAWGGNRELFYVQPAAPGSEIRTLMSVAVVTVPTFSAGKPVPMFGNADLATPWGRSYDVAPDGRRFLLTLMRAEPARPTQMVFVQHWLEELKRVVPTP